MVRTLDHLLQPTASEEHVPVSLESGTYLTKQPQAPARAHQRTWLPRTSRGALELLLAVILEYQLGLAEDEASASSSFSWTRVEEPPPFLCSQPCLRPPALSGNHRSLVLEHAPAALPGVHEATWVRVGREGFEESSSSWMLRSIGLRFSPSLTLHQMSSLQTCSSDGS